MAVDAAGFQQSACCGMPTFAVPDALDTAAADTGQKGKYSE
jgi:hypothetical protein